MLESIDKIRQYTRGVSKEKFTESTAIQDAVLRRLEVIGEAVKALPAEIKEREPRVRWRDVAGLRDVLIHAYFGVNAERVWRVLEHDLGPLKDSQERILRGLRRP